jgi:hypothetical protein
MIHPIYDPKISPLRGYGYVAPLGLWFVGFLFMLWLCRPSGALVCGFSFYAMVMSPLWGFGLWVFFLCYGYVAPQGL